MAVYHGCVPNCCHVSPFSLVAFSYSQSSLLHASLSALTCASFGSVSTLCFVYSSHEACVLTTFCLSCAALLYSALCTAFFTWVDFLAIAPFYASLALPQEVRERNRHNRNHVVSAFLLNAATPSPCFALLCQAGGAGSLGVIRILRLVRVARVVKVSRYSASIRVFSEAMRASVKPLTMLVFLMSLAMVGQARHYTLVVVVV